MTGNAEGTPTATAIDRKLPERVLWDALAAQGRVRGDYPGFSPAPWPVRVLMGAAGWMAAVFLQLFVATTLFVAARDHALVLAVSGLAMVALATVLYRRKAGNTAFEQFSLALSLAGQGLAIFGAGEALGWRTPLESPLFWAGVAVFEAALYPLVSNRLHRLLAACSVLGAAAVALATGTAPLTDGMMVAVPWVLTGMSASATVLVAAYTVAEVSSAAAARQAWVEPAADALLLLMLVGALFVTGMSHPLALLMDPADLGAAADRARGSLHWLAGSLIGLVAVWFAWVETGRLGLTRPGRLATGAATACLAVLMAGAPAVVAGVLALALALRRGSMIWFGLAVATTGAGFVWYYSALHWNLLIKSATLVAGGVVVLLCRAMLNRRRVAGNTNEETSP